VASRTVKKWLDDDFFRHPTEGSSTSQHRKVHSSSGAPSLTEPSPNPILPEFDAKDFRAQERIDNPYFPHLPGTVYTYGLLEEGEAVERNDVFSTFESKRVLGVNTHVVRDTAYEDGLLVEDTLDFYAQDKQGNVWYFGEFVLNYRYDDEGNYLSTDSAGAWLADGVDAFPGYIMPTREVLESLGNGYFQEFAPGVAVDQADLVTFDATADLDIGSFKGVLQTLDTTKLELDVREYKKYEPGVGFIAAEVLNDEGELELAEQLLGIRLVKENSVGKDLFKDRCDPDLKDLIEEPQDLGFEQPELRDFRCAGSEVHITYLGGDTDSNNALGVYTFDHKSGRIDDVQVLFPEADEVELGEEFTIELDTGEGYGLFLIPNGAEIGLDLSAFEEGGLEMKNFLTGKQASIHDRLAPILVDESGTALPIAAFHALDVNTRDDWNLLNPAGGIHAVELDPDALEDSRWDEKADVLGFEDMFVSDPDYEGDFDDVVVAVSRTSLPAGMVADLAEDLSLAATAI
jgi:hypothetical protein